MGQAPIEARGRKFALIDICEQPDELVASTAINVFSQVDDSFSWLSSKEEFLQNFKMV
jgi:hypothetical protein